MDRGTPEDTMTKGPRMSDSTEQNQMLNAEALKSKMKVQSEPYLWVLKEPAFASSYFWCLPVNNSGHCLASG